MGSTEIARLEAAKPGQFSIADQNVDGGGELTDRTADAHLVFALHAWFEAQFADHVSDAMTGHGPSP